MKRFQMFAPKSWAAFAALAFAGLFVAACGPRPDGAGAAGATEALSQKEVAAVAEKMSAAVRHEMEKKRIPAMSVALLAEGRTIWAGGFGVARAATSAAATADTIYRVGSISKLFTELAIMQLVEAGKIDLDAPVSAYLPEFRPENPFGGEILVRHLFSHQSGLVREPPVGHYFDDTEPSLRDTVMSLNATTLVAAPGTVTKYSNAGVAILGLIIEDIDGKPFEAALTERLLVPLGLTRSAFRLTSALEADLAEGYMRSYDDEQFIAPRYDLGSAPAGNMYASMNELAAFAEALMARGEGKNGRFIGAETLEGMWRPQGEAGAERSFGLGFALSEIGGGEGAGVRVVGHGGAIYGFVADLRLAPDDGVGVALAANVDQAATARLSDYALRLLLAAKAGAALPDFATSEPPATELRAALAGEYRSDASIIIVRDLLGRLRIEGLTNPLELRREGGDWVIDADTTYSREVAVDTAAETISIDGETFRRLTTPLPPAPAPEIAGLIGDYGWRHDYIRLYEWGGELHARIEWNSHYLLTRRSEDEWAFPQAGLYKLEALKVVRDETGAATALSLNGIVFPRRDFGGEVKAKLRAMMRPSAELLENAWKASPPAEAGKRKSDLVELITIDPALKLDVKYATTDNFVGFPVYAEARAFAQRPAAEALARAHAGLRAQGLGIVIHDAYRPWAITKVFWDATPAEGKNFVADPSQGSRHNRGCAIDLSLYDLETRETVEMPGGYDEMSARSYPGYIGGTDRQRWHRERLYEAMTDAGFDVYEFEWWHYDFRSWREYRVENIPFSEID